MNPFRYRLDDRVVVVGGHHEGQTGFIKAMELRRISADREAIIVTVKNADRTFCTPEHNVRPQ